MKPDLEDLRRLAEAATPGPWYDTNGSVWIDTRHQVCCGRGQYECCGNPDIAGGQESLADSSPNNAAFIAAANPQTVRYLLDRIKELEAGLRPFANAAYSLDCSHKDHSDIWESSAATEIDAYDLRRARALLEGE